MAIGPNQLNESFMEDVELYEKKIDQSLATRKIAPNSIIFVDVPPGMNSSHFRILKERYIKVGWGDVKWNSDQKEGEWLTFDTKKPSRSEGYFGPR